MVRTNCAPYEHRTDNRRVIARFLVLVAAFHLPQILARAGVPAGMASALLLLFFPLAWWLARPRSFGAAYALEWRPGTAAMFVSCLAGAVLAKWLALAGGAALGVVTFVGLRELDPVRTALQLATVALVTFVPSIAEDILTRGFLMRGRVARAGAFTFVAVTSLVYVLNHVWRLDRGPAEWAMLFVFGVTYAAAAWRTGSLWAAVGLHWGWNLAGSAIDAVADVNVVGGAGWLLSSAAHAVMLAVCLRGLRRQV
jgi:membrane protease YdiL (CAAX protease family)